MFLRPSESCMKTWLHLGIEAEISEFFIANEPTEELLWSSESSPIRVFGVAITDGILTSMELFWKLRPNQRTVTSV